MYQIVQPKSLSVYLCSAIYNMYDKKTH